MKLNYKRQLLLTIVIIIVFDLLNTFLKHWVFTSIGYCICGLIWIVHPVMIGNYPATKRGILLVRLAGIVMILFGVFTRSYFY